MQVDFVIFTCRITLLPKVGLVLFSSFAYDQEGFVFDRIGEKDTA